MRTPEKARYGVDGYPFLVGLFGAAGSLGLGALVLARLRHSRLAALTGAAAVLPLVPALLGAHYVLWGKLRHRDRLLDAVAWRGDETVLDVGTGAGLLLIGAAKRARNGRCIGIDIWREGDLSGNCESRTRRNAVIEGVWHRVEIRSEDARALGLGDASVDVVLSMLCLHNIEERREQALAEIVRVTKPGAFVVLSDLAHVGEYGRFFEARGFSVTHHGLEADTFPPQRWLVARKQA